MPHTHGVSLWLVLGILLQEGACQCTLGEYEDASSPGTCVTCGNGGINYACGSGEFMDGQACEGLPAMSDPQTCAPCFTHAIPPTSYVCGVGEYMDGQSCNGMTFHDTQTCAVCGNGGATYDCGSGTATGAACDGMTTVDTQTCSSSGGGSGDPHLSFPNGGRADFRGSHRACYVFVSSAGFQFAPFFQEVDFLFTSPQGVLQLVHGTFMTSVFWRVRTSAGRELLVRGNAMHKAELDVMVIPYGRMHTDASVEVVHIGEWQRRQWDDVHIEARMLTASVETPLWQVNVTSKPIYGLMEPILNETHYHGRWEPEQRRFDVTVRGVFPQPNAHGIIGQSYRDSTVRNGKLDEYGAVSTPELIDSDGNGPEMTTSAQAEGAIDGSHADYKLQSPFSVDFAFSRYRVATAEPDKSTSGNNKRLVTTQVSEWDGPTLVAPASPVTKEG